MATIIIEVMLVCLLIYGYVHEQDIIKWEQRVKQDLFDEINDYIRKKGW